MVVVVVEVEEVVDEVVEEAAEAKAPVPPPLSADEARAAAAAEGLELVPSSSSETGFKGVRKKDNKFEGRIQENGRKRYIGIFATPEEAALCCARHIGAERAAAEAAEAMAPVLPPLSADEARAAAAAEGLELEPSSKSATAFKGVSKNGSKYVAMVWDNRKKCYLGIFATPEEAALCYARHIGAERAAAEAAENEAKASADCSRLVTYNIPWHPPLMVAPGSRVLMPLPRD